MSYLFLSCTEDDELLVTDFYQNVPCFRFMGRKMTVDLVGEKINHFIALIVIEHFKQHDYLPEFIGLGYIFNIIIY